MMRESFQPRWYELIVFGSVLQLTDAVARWKQYNLPGLAAFADLTEKLAVLQTDQEKYKVPFWAWLTLKTEADPKGQLRLNFLRVSDPDNKINLGEINEKNLTDPRQGMILMVSILVRSDDELTRLLGFSSQASLNEAPRHRWTGPKRNNENL